MRLINDKLKLKADEMLRFAQQTEDNEKLAISLANKMNESHTKSFLAKNKMIEVKFKIYFIISMFCICLI